MKIKDIYKQTKPVISFEIFPPNAKFPVEKIFTTIEELAQLKPDFISVTYGAGGSSKGRTVEIASRIKNKYGIESLAHLTCVGTKIDEMNNVIKELQDNNVNNILALRGDLPRDRKNDTGSDFEYASDLTTHIKNNFDISVGGAFYPEGHNENNDLIDLINLKKKVDAGSEFLISQLFFDNNDFYEYKEKCEKIGINVPLVAGIIPVTNYKQISRIQELSGARIPEKLQRILDRYKDNPVALEEAGTIYAIEQITDLITSGVSGIHLYTMNKSKTTKRIIESIQALRDSLK